MYKKDYILQMIEQMADMLAAIIGLRESGNFEKALDQIEHAYENILKTEGDSIREIPKTDLIVELENEFEFSIHHMGMIAELMKTEADILSEQKAEKEAFALYEKALILLEHVDKSSKTYSFDRIGNISYLKTVLGK